MVRIWGCLRKEGHDHRIVVPPPPSGQLKNRRLRFSLSSSPCPTTQRYPIILVYKLNNTDIEFKQADEAQRGHYNDGYPGYTITPNPYDEFDNQQQAYTPNPFNPPPPPPVSHNMYSSPPPVLYGGPPPMHISPTPPIHPHSPPTLPLAYSPPLPPHQQPSMLNIPFQNPGPPPPITPISPSGYHQRYDLHDEGFEQDHGDHDTGDIPLLRRDQSQSSWHHVNMPMPGGFEDEDSNIRYGRIPQRVPRRYKTIKRIE